MGRGTLVVPEFVTPFQDAFLCESKRFTSSPKVGRNSAVGISGISYVRPKCGRLEYCHIYCRSTRVRCLAPAELDLIFQLGMLGSLRGSAAKISMRAATGSFIQDARGAFPVAAARAARLLPASRAMI